MTLQITLQSVQCNTNVLIVLALYWLCMALYGSCFCSCFWDLLGLLARHIAEEDFQMLRSKLFPNFLETNPAAQSYVTQSATRINFVAEKILGLSLEPRLISAVKSQNFTKPSHPSCESLDSLDSGMWSAVWPSNYIKLIRPCLLLPCDAMCHLPPGRICTVPARKLVEDRLHSRGRWKSSGGQLLWGVCSPHCFSVLHPFASFAHHILNIHLKHCCHAQLCHTHTQYCHTYTPIHTHNIVTAGVAFMTLGLLGWTGLVWCDASCFLLLMRDRHHLCGRRWATFPWLCVARVAVAPRHIMWQALHVLPLNEAMKYLLCGKHRATLSHKLQHKHTHTRKTPQRHGQHSRIWHNAVTHHIVTHPIGTQTTFLTQDCHIRLCHTQHCHTHTHNFDQLCIIMYQNTHPPPLNNKRANNQMKDTVTKTTSHRQDCQGTTLQVLKHTPLVRQPPFAGYCEEFNICEN